MINLKESIGVFAQHTGKDNQVNNQNIQDGLRVKIANTKEELESAYKLVYENYLKKGYINPHPSKMRMSNYNLLPTTTTFMALLKEKIIATVTLIVDTPFGLPMDELYKQELDSIRSKGYKIAEVSSLVCASDSTFSSTAKLNTLKELFRMVTSYARKLGVDVYCITVNPTHIGFYQKYLLFTQIGEIKSYSKVNGASAVPLLLNINPRVAEERYKNTFVNKEHHSSNFYKYAILEADSQISDSLQHKSGFPKHPLNEVLIKYFFCGETNILKFEGGRS